MNKVKLFIKKTLKSNTVIFKLVQSILTYLNRYLRFARIIHKFYNTDNVYVEINHGNNETFFGYYDKVPVNRNGKALFHSTEIPTSKKPNNQVKIHVGIYDLRTKDFKMVASSNSYNWQQGTRLQWLNDNEFVYNDFCEKKGIYVTKRYNLAIGGISDIYEFPIQETLGEEMFYSLNYRRLRSLREDYGYYNLPKMSSLELKSIHDDGIWEINYQTKKSSLIFSINEIIKINYRESFSDYYHWLNHIMVSPNKTKVVFLHRCRKGINKLDRLFTFCPRKRKLNLIVDYSTISHFNWINEVELICFFYGNGKELNYKKINTLDNYVEETSYFGEFNDFDGHPTVKENVYLTDTYPDRFGFQKLIFSHEKNSPKIIGEFYHSLKFKNVTRCDLHPKYFEGKVFFDQVNNFKRRASIIDLKI